MCVAQAFASGNDFNGRFVFGNYKSYPDTDISIGHSSEDGKDVDLLCLRKANTKNIGELGEERRNLAKNVKNI